MKWVEHLAVRLRSSLFESVSDVSRAAGWIRTTDGEGQVAVIVMLPRLLLSSPTTGSHLRTHMLPSVRAVLNRSRTNEHLDWPTRPIPSRRFQAIPLKSSLAGMPSSSTRVPLVFSALRPLAELTCTKACPERPISVAA